MIESEIDINEIDESFSNPLQVKTLPFDREDLLSSLNGKFEDVMDTNEPRSVGRIKLEWELRDTSKVKQINVNWLSAEETLTQRKSFDATTSKCHVPVTKQK